MEEIKVKILVTKEEYIKYSKSEFWRVTGKVLFFLGVLIFGCSLFLGVNIYLTEVRVAGEMIFYGVFALFLLLFIPLSIGPGAAKLYESDLYLHEEKCIVFSGDQIYTETCLENRKIPWDYIHKVKEYKYHVVILLSQEKGIILPKDQIVEQIDFIKRSVSDHLDHDKLPSSWIPGEEMKHLVEM